MACRRIHTHEEPPRFSRNQSWKIGTRVGRVNFLRDPIVHHLSFGSSFWERCIPGCGPGAQARFKETLGLFFEAVNIQARARDNHEIPDLESYIDVRRDTSGKLCHNWS